MNSVTELNKQKVRLFVEAVVNEGRVELIDELVAADYAGHIPHVALAVVGRDELRRLVIAGRLTNPDLYIKIEDQIAEDDLVATRWRATAVVSESGGVGIRRSWSGISVTRLLAGKQVDLYTAVNPSTAHVAV